MPTSDKIRLRNVRLSFPYLSQRKTFEDSSGPGKFQATFLLDPGRNADEIEAIRAAAKEIAAEQWPKGVPNLKGKCFGFADEEGFDYDGWEGQFFVSAKEDIRPQVRDQKGHPAAEDDPGFPYAGCYVDAWVTLWTQDNKWGKRINGNLLAVQFRADGEAFSGRAGVSDEEFDDLSGQEVTAGDDPFDDDDVPF